MIASIIRGFRTGLKYIAPLAVLIWGWKLLDQHFHSTLAVVYGYSLGVTMLFCVLALALLIPSIGAKHDITNKVVSGWTAICFTFLSLLVAFTPVGLLVGVIWLVLCLVVIPPAVMLLRAAGVKDLQRNNTRA
jgi:hypothetical protein